MYMNTLSFPSSHPPNMKKIPPFQKKQQNKTKQNKNTLAPGSYEFV